ncbi:MAG: hypothetical protein OSB62_08120 [Alphaproteobacteria bacterium]|nr:hypothetical protein [Alphaproteobacteria bacterium]
MKHIQVIRPTFLAGKPVKVGDEFKGDEITKDHIALVFAGKAKCMDEPKTAPSADTESIQAELDAANEKLESFEKTEQVIAGKDTEIEELTSERDELKSDLDSANNAIAEKDEENQNLTEARNALKDDVDVLADKLSTSDADLKTANDKIADLEKQLKTAKK